jgi:cytochrome-b5 reductase
MSQHMASLKIGDSMLMKGPKGHLDYAGCGKFTITHKRNHKIAYNKKKLGLVAGGTGITPMLQIIHAIAKNPADHTEVWLIFANQTEEDILLRKELDALPKDRFHLFYTVDRAPNDQWKHGVGFVNADMFRKHLPPPSEDTMLFVCGPPPMIKFACEPAFKELGFTEDQWFAF